MSKEILKGYIEKMFLIIKPDGVLKIDFELDNISYMFGTFL